MFTKLDIINEMVVSTGLRAFAAEQDQHPAYIKAERVLKQVSLSVLTRGLWFNTEQRVLTPTSDNEIVVPSTCIKADPIDGNINLTKRGLRMYNLNTGSYEVEEDVEMKMLFEVPLEEMPVSAQEYIRCACVYKYYLDDDGSGPKLQAYKQEMGDGWMWLWREHIRSRQVNAFDNPYNTVAQLRKGSRPLYTGSLKRGIVNGT